MMDPEKIGDQFKTVFRGLRFDYSFPDEEIKSNPHRVLDENIDFDDVGKHWTTDKLIAAQFATRYARGRSLGVVLEGQVPHEAATKATHSSVYGPEQEVTLSQPPAIKHAHIMRRNQDDHLETIHSVEMDK